MLLKKFVQIAHGQAASLRDHLRRQVRVAQLFVDVMFDALQMHGCQVRTFTAEHSLIVAQGH